MESNYTEHLHFIAFSVPQSKQPFVLDLCVPTLQPSAGGNYRPNNFNLATNFHRKRHFGSRVSKSRQERSFGTEGKWSNQAVSQTQLKIENQYNEQNEMYWTDRVYIWSGVINRKKKIDVPNATCMTSSLRIINSFLEEDTVCCSS